MPPTSTSTSTSTSAENKSLEIIRPEDKLLYSRLVSKESSVANPSFRVYYGVASGAVPFVWESQPGTPKNPIYDRTLPPLTPPPSYYSNSNSNSNSNLKKKKKSNNKIRSTCSNSNSKPNLLITTILPKFSLKKTHSQSHSHSSSSSTTSSSASSSSNSSSSSSSSSSSANYNSVGPQNSRPARLSSPRSSFSSRGDEYDSDDGSPTSTLCFCSARHGHGGRARGYKSVMGMKDAVLSIVGHGSG